MTKNMGWIDRIIRVVLAVVVAVLYFTGSISGAAAVILGILAVIFLITGVVGLCPLYLPFGIKTLGKGKGGEE